MVNTAVSSTVLPFSRLTEVLQQRHPDWQSASLPHQRFVVAAHTLKKLRQTTGLTKVIGPTKGTVFKDLRPSAAVAHAAAALTEVDVTASENATAYRISRAFEQLKKEGKVAFIPYLTAGDPNLATTKAAVKLLDKCGADIIELGVPYSDPLADGPVIQAAATRGINGGTNLDSVLTLMREELSDVKAPVVIFLYYNPLLKRGVGRFLEEAKAAGVSGLVVPDLPLEETEKLRQQTSAAGLELVLLTTPTTPNGRMTAITEATQGFTYLVSLTGVTGARENIDDRVQGLLKDIKKVSNKPVAVGFGVSSPEQASKLARWGADGVIIGSAVVKLLGESKSPEEGLARVEDFAISIRTALSASRDV